MAERKIPGAWHGSETRNKILDESLKLFALKGFNAVSVRDIAKAVGIRMSSLYNYYASKDDLLEDVLARFESGYRHYFSWLTGENANANSLEELMDNMFNDEFLEMRDPIGCLGMSLITKEQHSNGSVRRRAFELFGDLSINSLQADFDRLVEKGVIPKSDTKMVATFFILCVIDMNNVRLHEYIGEKPPVDCAEIYRNLRKVLTSLLLQGQESPSGGKLREPSHVEMAGNG